MPADVSLVVADGSSKVLGGLILSGFKAPPPRSMANFASV